MNPSSRIGPFRIVDLVGKQAYRLALPAHYRIHNVFHVSYLELRKRRANNDTSPELPSPDLIDDEEEYEIKEILNRRCRKGRWQYEVKWAGYPTEYNEWISEENMGGSESLRQEYDSKAEAKRKRKKGSGY